MQFYLTSTNGNDPDRLLERYPWLRKYGFKDNHITVNTLEELVEIANEMSTHGCGICVFARHQEFDRKKLKWVDTNEPEIELYDGYRE